MYLLGCRRLSAELTSFNRTASCEAVRLNKFWNKKIYGWFHSFFLNLNLKNKPETFNLKVLPSMKVSSLLAKRKQMVRAEPTTICTPSISINTILGIGNLLQTVHWLKGFKSFSVPKTHFYGSGYGSASHDAVRIKCWVCHSSGTVLVAYVVVVFKSAVPVVFSSVLTLETFVLVVVLACLNSWDQFSLLFSKVSKV